MRNQPGISWGYDAQVNLMRSSKGWLAIFCHEDGTREIIKIFKLKDAMDQHEMMKQLAMWNYGTCELCPVVRAATDWG